MGNSLSSSRRQPKRVASPRKVKHVNKSPKRFGFGSRKDRGFQQQQAVAAATPKKKFGLGSKKNRALQAQAAPRPKKRFGFTSKKNRAHHQHPETSAAPAAIRNIKAKISPSPAPVATNKRSHKNNPSSLAKRFGPLAFSKAKASGVGPFKRQQHAPPPAKRGFLNGLTSSRNRRRY